MLPIVSQRKHSDPSETGSGLYENLDMDLLKKKFQEIELWKKETERLKKEQQEAETMQRKLINDTFQVIVWECLPNDYVSSSTRHHHPINTSFLISFMRLEV